MTGTFPNFQLYVNARTLCYVRRCHAGNVIKKLVAGIINIDAYRSNRTEEMANFELGQPYLINENMLLIGQSASIGAFDN